MAAADVHARMCRSGLAVVNALVAKAPADAPFKRTHERLGEVDPGIIRLANGGHGGLLAANAFGDFRRRLHGFWRYPIDMLDGPLAFATST